MTTTGTLDNTYTYQLLELKKADCTDQIREMLRNIQPDEICWSTTQVAWLGIRRGDQIFHLEELKDDYGSVAQYQYEPLHMAGAIGIVFYRKMESTEYGFGLIDFDTESVITEITSSNVVGLVVDSDDPVEKKEENLGKLKQIIQNLQDLLNHKHTTP